jgi:DNA-binding IclR family transcriptional regulator
VERDPDNNYSAGPTLRRIAATVHDGSPLDRLIATAQPHLDALAHTTRESCYLAVGDPSGATYVATAESPHPIRHVGWVGQTVPADGTAVGAALAQPGVAVTRSGTVEPDIAAISLGLPPVPSLSTTGALPVAVSVIGPTHRLTGDTHDNARRALQRTVAALAADLGLEPTTKDANP